MNKVETDTYLFAVRDEANARFMSEVNGAIQELKDEIAKWEPFKELNQVFCAAYDDMNPKVKVWELAKAKISLAREEYESRCASLRTLHGLNVERTKDELLVELHKTGKLSLWDIRSRGCDAEV